MCQHCNNDPAQIPLPFINAAELPAIPYRPDVHPDGTGEAVCTCDSCGGECEADDLHETVGHEHVCPDCSVSCSSCGAIHRTDSEDTVEAREDNGQRHPDTEVYCRDCAHRCDDCSEYYQELSSRNASDEPICSRCAENYYTCEECDCIIHGDDMRCHDDRTLCQSCFESAEADDAIAGLHEHDYKPRPEFYRGREERQADRTPDLFLGVEIEVERRGSLEIADAIEEIPEQFYCKTDGSLTNGFEIVSHPCSWQWWSEAPLHFAEVLRKGGFRSYDTDTCGMHVHVSKSALSEVERVKLQLFFRENPEFVCFISRRKKVNLNRWACVDAEGVRQFIRKAQRGNCHSERYTALNFENARTVEFRIFRGTLDTAAIKRNLAFVVALCRFVRGASHTQLNVAELRKWIEREGKPLLGAELQSALIAWIVKYQTSRTLTPEESSQCA